MGQGHCRGRLQVRARVLGKVSIPKVLIGSSPWSVCPRRHRDPQDGSLQEFVV